MGSRDLAVAFFLGLIGSQAAPPPPACISLFIGLAPGTAPDISGPTLKDLTSVLQSRGFCIARTPLDAEAAIELLGRRQLPKRVQSIANRSTYVNLIRLEAATGDATEEPILRRRHVTGHRCAQRHRSRGARRRGLDEGASCRSARCRPASRSIHRR